MKLRALQTTGGFFFLYLGNKQPKMSTKVFNWTQSSTMNDRYVPMCRGGGEDSGGAVLRVLGLPPTPLKSLPNQGPRTVAQRGYICPKACHPRVPTRQGKVPPTPLLPRTHKGSPARSLVSGRARGCAGDLLTIQTCCFICSTPEEPGLETKWACTVARGP